MSTTPKKTRKEEMIPVLQRQRAQKFRMIWDLKDRADVDFLQFTDDFWKFFIATGKHATSFAHGLYEQFTEIVLVSMNDPSPEDAMRIVDSFVSRVLIHYDDAFYRAVVVSDTYAFKWEIVEGLHAKVRGITFPGFVACIEPTGVSNTSDFILWQSSSPYDSIGFKLTSYCPNDQYAMPGEWLYREVHRTYEEIVDL